MIQLYITNTTGLGQEITNIFCYFLNIIRFLIPALSLEFSYSLQKAHFVAFVEIMNNIN